MWSVRILLRHFALAWPAKEKWVVVKIMAVLKGAQKGTIILTTTQMLYTDASVTTLLYIRTGASSPANFEAV